MQFIINEILSSCHFKDIPETNTRVTVCGRAHASDRFIFVRSRLSKCEMIALYLVRPLRSCSRVWRHPALSKPACKFAFWNCQKSRLWFSTLTHGPVRNMDEILRKTVAPLPSYETRDKSPPPPESHSVEFMNFYQSLEKEQRLEFLERLSEEYGVDHKGVSELAGKLLETQLRDVATILQVEDRLRYSLTPRYRQLLSHISRVGGGVKFLVDLRADVIEITSSKASDSPHLRVNSDMFIVLRWPSIVKFDGFRVLK